MLVKKKEMIRCGDGNIARKAITTSIIIAQFNYRLFRITFKAFYELIKLSSQNFSNLKGLAGAFASLLGMPAILWFCFEVMI